MTEPTRDQVHRIRTTLPLTGTVTRTTAQLDHASDVALAYAQAWLAGNGSLKVPASGVMRRAVRLYVAHLEHADAESEVREIERACKTSKPDVGGQNAAWDRLQSLDPAQPLPPYTEVLHGPASASLVATVNARAEELFNQIARSPWGRLKRLKATDSDVT